MNAPVVIFAYRRIDQLAHMLTSLQQCDGFSSTPIFVFCDGEKGQDDRADVEAVRTYLSNLNWPHLRIELSDQNRGLRASVFNGVSKVISEHGTAIVLEDDLHLSPLTLTYFNNALAAYADHHRVWSISGYMYDVPALRGRTEAFFLPFAQSWGWATWKRAWQQFDPEEAIPDFIENSPSFRRAFSVNGISDYANQLHLAKHGYTDSWYLRWYFKIFREGGVSLFPPITYVGNRGVSGRGGTHAGRLNPYDLLVKPATPSVRMVGMPTRVEVDFEAMDSIPKSWEATVLREIHRLGSIKRKLASSLGLR